MDEEQKAVPEKKKKPKRKGTGIRKLSYPELIETLHHLQSTERGREAILISLLYLTGCRISELRKIRRSQITFDLKAGKPYITFQGVETLKRIKRWRKVLWQGTTKTVLEGKGQPTDKINEANPTRDVMMRTDLEPEIITIIQPLLNKLSPESLIWGLSRTRSHAILYQCTFTGYQGEPIRFFPHLLRHLRALHLIERYGWGSYELKAFIGWSSVQTSDKYVDLSQDRLIKKLNDIPAP